MALIYSIVMFKRCHEMSQVQRVNTVLLAEGNASQELIARLNKYGFCLGKSMKYTIQEEIASHFLDHAVDIVFDRESSGHLPDEGQQKNLATCNLSELINVKLGETRVTRERYKFFVRKILCELFPAFEFLKEILPEYSPCRYQEEMKQQSLVVSLPVLMKDEKKYADIVDVLDQLEEWVKEIYVKAGLCVLQDTDNAVPPAPLIAAPSRPDQPASHIPPVPQAEDPLACVKIPCFGDQLTRVRHAGAKDLIAATTSFPHPRYIVEWFEFMKGINGNVTRRDQSRCVTKQRLLH
ncbi:hypothetical protein P5673_006167 [Acropora cervicornis]|uniref:Uncharacterized protein n=1 Tax=Acropora cervicornis TaxID=6130 RepID=A0AAD9QY53_ACRCE|nr:hypothetical protein P5673_006167 [Acropora cervicornis]